MKKYISKILIAAMAVGSLMACDVETDEKPGGTSVQDMAGYWDVTAYSVGSGNSLEKATDVFSLQTYNTAANTPDSMWINDLGNFWGFKFKLAVNYGAKTFSCTAKNYNPANKDAGNATITDGQVLMGKGHNLHGMPCDSIAFKIKFDDDDKGRTFLVAGVRHSGFTE